MEPNDKPFYIGLCLAGAVSAGAYTAGVIDYLIEALQDWQQRKESNQPDVPTHNVQIPIIGGASAGGMTGLILSSAINQPYFPLRDIPSPLFQQQPQHMLYHAWVDLTADDMFPELLKTDDLHPAEVQSLLNASFIDSIAKRVIQPKLTPAIQPPFIDSYLKIMVTLSNLRGFDYDVSFKSSVAKNKYWMTLHNDYACFVLNTDHNKYAGDGWTPLNFFNSSNLDIAREAAMATGAFPIGLKAREVTRYTQHVKEIFWLKGIFKHATLPTTQKFKTLNVDGGLINNEPFEKVQDVLLNLTKEKKEEQQDFDKFKSTVIMVAPFPSEPSTFNSSSVLSTVTGNTFSAMIEQMRTKPEVMAAAWNSDDASQFLISPSRPDPTGSKMFYGSHAIACGALDGFSGFLNKNFRVHDFFLGRTNCERFLRHHFTVSADTTHPHFAKGYANVVNKERFKSPTDKSLQIIPLFTEEKKEMPLPQFSNGTNWPALPEQEIDRFRGALKKRMQGLLLNWDHYRWDTKFLLWAGAKLVLNRKLADMALAKIKGSLNEHELLL